MDFQKKKSLNMGYLQNDDALLTNEGNCGITSTSNILAYYSRFGGFINLPRYDSLVMVYPGKDPYFIKKAREEEHYLLCDSKEIHRIYSTVRSKAICYGYVGNGMDDYMTNIAYEKTCDFYNYHGTRSRIESNHYNIIKREINNNHTLQLITYKDVYYNGHGTIVTGYRKYKAYIPLSYSSIFQLELCMLSIYDGWTLNERWYDLTEYSTVFESSKRAVEQNLYIYSIA